MDISHEQIHSLRNSLGTISMAMELIEGARDAEAVDIVRRNIIAADEVLRTIQEHDKIEHPNN